jgi:hypothetical protein
MLEEKERRIKSAPELEKYFIHLEGLIQEHPETGIPDSCLLDNGKTISCLRKTIKLFLFSGRIRYDRSQLTAQYVYNDTAIFIFGLYFSI